MLSTHPQHHAPPLPVSRWPWGQAVSSSSWCVLPVLLTTAHLWQEATLTSLHATHTTFNSALRFLPCSHHPIPQHSPCTVINSASCCEKNVSFNHEKLAEIDWATAPRLFLYLKHEESVPSLLSTLTDSYECSAWHPPTRIFIDCQKRNRAMLEEGRVCRTYREEQRTVRIKDSSCRVEKYGLEMCRDRETDEVQHWFHKFGYDAKLNCNSLILHINMVLQHYWSSLLMDTGSNSALLKYFYIFAASSIKFHPNLCFN